MRMSYNWQALQPPRIDGGVWRGALPTARFLIDKRTVGMIHPFPEPSEAGVRTSDPASSPRSEHRFQAESGSVEPRVGVVMNHTSRAQRRAGV